MNKRRFISMIRILSISILPLTILVSCGRTSVVPTDTENEAIVDKGETSAIEDARAETDEPGEYDGYLRRIWIEDSWNGKNYTGKVSFYFTEIDNGQIKGKIMLGEIAEPEYVLYQNPEDILRSIRAEMFDLYGMIVDEIGQCTYRIPQSVYYKDENGERVRAAESMEHELTIQFQSDQELLIDGEMTLRPYRLSDIDGYMEKAYSCAFSNEVWDDCFLTVIQMQNEDGKWPDAYLTDGEDYILYHFRSLYQTDSEVKDVQMDDVNADGLTDIRLFTGYADDDLEPVERVFIQYEDGTFQEEILRRYQPAGQGIFYGYFEEDTEWPDFARYEELGYELQEAIQNQTIDSVLQAGESRFRRLSEHEISNLKYLDLSGNLRNYSYVYSMQYIRDGLFEWYALEQNEERTDIWVCEGNGYTFYSGDCLEKGRFRFRLGIPLAITDELCFVEFEGLYYPCIPKRSDSGMIESVQFYTFEISGINGGYMEISADDIKLFGYAV